MKKALVCGSKSLLLQKYLHHGHFFGCFIAVYAQNQQHKWRVTELLQ